MKVALESLEFLRSIDISGFQDEYGIQMWPSLCHTFVLFALKAENDCNSTTQPKKQSVGELHQETLLTDNPMTSISLAKETHR